MVDEQGVRDPGLMQVRVDDHFIPRHELVERLRSIEKDIEWMKWVGGAVGTFAGGLLITAVVALIRFWGT